MKIKGHKHKWKTILHSRKIFYIPMRPVINMWVCRDCGKLKPRIPRKKRKGRVG